MVEATNKFKPNSSLVDQNETSTLFGLIKLNEFSNTNSFDSQILTDERQSFELID
jgi:hypothetical protein